MSCKKCNKTNLYENNTFKLKYCNDCDIIEIENKNLWHINRIKVSDINDLRNINYSFNYIIFTEINKLYNCIADNDFIDIVNFIESYLNEQ